MPTLAFSDEELRDICMALRAAAHRATQDAQATSASSKDHGFEATAQRYSALAAKVEDVRRGLR